LELPEHGHRLEQLLVGDVATGEQLEDRIPTRFDEVPDRPDVGLLQLFEKLPRRLGMAGFKSTGGLVEARRLEKVLSGGGETAHAWCSLLPEVFFVRLPEAIRQRMERLAGRTRASLDVGVELLDGVCLGFPVAFHAYPARVDLPLLEERIAIEAVPLEFVP